ncbi:optic atrophy 3 protein homolog isoform X2 [Lycorma delicatula]|uniref:optic atrophy 3 protein homolog isoform X2 n=1 Tax=Lycorma delicatula TaxID=130591 RepID=UPI003F50F766
MVIQAFPAAKLGALLLRQISKPIATFIKEKAKGHPFFRTYVCMPPAHFYNWCEVKMKMWILNLGKPVNVPPLNEAMAIELGSNILGEAIIFFTAAGLILREYVRQIRKEEMKEEARNQELSFLNYTVKELNFQIEKQYSLIRDLHREINHLEDHIINNPWKRYEKEKSTAAPPSPPETSTVIPQPPAENTELNKPHVINAVAYQSEHEVNPMHLDHINRDVTHNPGVLLTAVAYLTNEIFNINNDYFTRVHL